MHDLFKKIYHGEGGGGDKLCMIACVFKSGSSKYPMGDKDLKRHLGVVLDSAGTELRNEHG